MAQVPPQMSPRGTDDEHRVVSPVEHVDIVPFSVEHLDAAGALLATRHRSDRMREQALPSHFETPAAARAHLAERLRRPGAMGVVAGLRGRVVGYLLGRTFFTPPMRRSFLAPRAGFIGYADHAVDTEDALDVYGALYGALATAWVNAGCRSHYVQVAATDARAGECWHALGFGRQFVTAMRETEAVALAEGPGDRRRARPEDLDIIMGFIDALHRFEAAAPISRPYLPEIPEERAVQAQMLEDPTCAHWIALRDGQPCAMQSFQPPPPDLSPLIVPDQSIYLPHGYTELSARGKGIGTGLLASAMTWIREAALRYCLLHFTASNLVSTRFWLGRGFRPIEYWLCHHLDDGFVSKPRDHDA